MHADQRPYASPKRPVTGYSDADWRMLEKRLSDTRDLLRDVLSHLRKVLDNLKMAGDQYKSAGRAWRSPGQPAQGARTAYGRRQNSPFTDAGQSRGAAPSARPAAPSAHAFHDKPTSTRPEPPSAASASRFRPGEHAKRHGEARNAAGPFSWSARGQEAPSVSTARNPWRPQSEARRPVADDTAAQTRRLAEERARQAREQLLREREAQAEKARREAARQAREQEVRARQARAAEERARREAREREARARQAAREKAQREFEARQRAKREQARQESSRNAYTPGCGTMTLTQACALLCVAYPCSVNDIKSAYRKQARRHHPDLGGDEEMMKSLNQAYELALSWCSPLRGKSAPSWAA
ncbi:hypothetical protein JCM15519_18940 [Fundidesulfovibrio butyratiphilus]